jgi:S1 RNA binding domain
MKRQAKKAGRQVIYVDDQQKNHNPWADAEARYQPGQQVQGTVTRVAQFGVYVQVEPGIAGIVYAFELGQESATAAGLVPGQELRLYVKSIDASRKRLELSFQNSPLPGLIEASKLEMPLTERRRQRSAESAWPVPSPLPDLPARLNEQRYCPDCHKVAAIDWKYCVYCGNSLRRYCPACGHEQPDLPDARYCCECGKALSS